MGAEQFDTKSTGETAQEAFSKAVSQAQFDYGHSGYSGTIAEKDSFVVIDVPHDMNREDYAELLMSNSDPRIDNKWGPAGCIDLGDGNYLFFGWASS